MVLNQWESGASFSLATRGSEFYSESLVRSGVTLSNRCSKCGRDEGVQGVLTLFCSGAAQVCHVLRAEELREQLEVEEEDGDRQEEEVEVESGEASQGECAMDGVRSELELWNVKCETITTVEQMRNACRLSACTPRNRRGQRRHRCSALWSACWCTRRSSFTCDAVVLIHFVLIALIP